MRSKAKLEKGLEGEFILKGVYPDPEMARLYDELVRWEEASKRSGHVIVIYP